MWNNWLRLEEKQEQNRVQDELAACEENDQCTKEEKQRLRDRYVELKERDEAQEEALIAGVPSDEQWRLRGDVIGAVPGARRIYPSATRRTLRGRPTERIF